MTSELARLLGGDVLTAARGLLGWRLRTTRHPGPTEIVLIEVEAYSGRGDEASHSSQGRTGRTRPMFGPAGGIYVYRSYGIHWCMNIVVGEEGRADAVLLRGGRPVAGASIMSARRGRRDHLADGPGKLTQAMGVTGDDSNTPLGEGGIELLPPVAVVGAIEATTRIGITRSVDLPWRFVLTAPPRE